MNKPQQQESWRKRITEKYLKEYVADEQEAREVMEILQTGPVWFEWWMDVISTERQRVIEEVREVIEGMKKKPKIILGVGLAYPTEDVRKIINQTLDDIIKKVEEV